MNDIARNYKGYEIRRNGTREYPYNIYVMRKNPYTRKMTLVHIGYERTLRDCKSSIDAGIYDDAEEI